MNKWWSDRRKHQDEEKIATEKQARENIRRLMDVGDEEGYVALVKKLRPDITPAELVAAIERFREYRRISASDARNPS
jgi:hypothetical protein